MWVSPDEYRIIGKTLAEIRKAAGLRQQDVAARLGKPQSFVSSYEAGQRRVDVLELIAIAAGIGVDPVTLFTELARRYKKSRRT